MRAHVTVDLTACERADVNVAELGHIGNVAYITFHSNGQSTMLSFDIDAASASVMATVAGRLQAFADILNQAARERT